MESIALTISIEALAMPRPRGRAIWNRAARKWVAMIYDEGWIRAYKSEFRERAAALWSRVEIEYKRPYAVEIVFFLHRPAKLPWIIRTARALAHVQKPDLDNLAKPVLDALTGVVWENDCEISRLVLEKWYTETNQTPRVVVKVGCAAIYRGE